MPENHFHIWPRGQFMMIALPNQDKSWTVTLFMPQEIFDSLDTPSKLIDFFEIHYRDTIPLIGKEKLVKDFFATKPSPMISVKVSTSYFHNFFVNCFISKHRLSHNRSIKYFIYPSSPHCELPSCGAPTLWIADKQNTITAISMREDRWSFSRETHFECGKTACRISAR